MAVPSLPAGVDWSQILGGVSSLAGAGLSASDQQKSYNDLQNALKTIGPTALNGFNMSGPGGMSSGYNPNGTANINLGSLNGAFANLAGAGTAGAGAYSPALLSHLTGASAGTLNPALATLGNAYNGNNAYQNAAATQAGGLDQTYNSIYGNTLANMRAQAAPGIQQQAYGLQNTLFGSGVANSTGAASGSLAAQNFGRGVAQGDASMQLAAQQAAQSGMANQAGIASSLSNTGNSLLSNAFSNFGNTNQLISGLNSAQLNNSLSALQGTGALNTQGLNNFMAALQTGSAQSTARNQSLFPYANVALGLSGTPTANTLLGQNLSSAGSSLMGSNGLSGLLNNIFGGNGSSSGLLGNLFGGGNLSAADTASLGESAANYGSQADSLIGDLFPSAGGPAAASGASGLSGLGSAAGGAAGAAGTAAGFGALGSGAATDAAVTSALGTVGAQTAGTSAAIAASNAAALGGSGAAAGSAAGAGTAAGSAASSGALSTAAGAAIPIAAFAAMYGLGNLLNGVFTGPNNGYSIGDINNMLGTVKGAGAPGSNGGINVLNPNGTIDQSKAQAAAQLQQLQDGYFGDANSYIAKQLNAMGYKTLGQQVAANGGFMPTAAGGGFSNNHTASKF